MSDRGSGKQISVVENLKEQHIAAARRNLKIGQCFAAFGRFEERVSRAHGVDTLSFWVWTTKRRGVVASGQIVIRFPGDTSAFEIGRWVVREEGHADFSLGSVALVKEPPEVIDRALNASWANGSVTGAIRAAKANGPIR